MTTRQSPDRITVSLIPKGRHALDRLTGTAGLSATDVVNRALQLYNFVQEQHDAGHTLALRRADGAVADIHIL